MGDNLLINGKLGLRRAVCLREVINKALMNLKSLVQFFGLLTALSCLMADVPLAQQHPEDPGFADTLYFEAGGLSSENGDTLFIASDTSGGEVLIYIKIWNDNPIAALGVPLIDSCGICFLDSSENNDGSIPACFLGSRVEEFGSLTLNLELNPPKVMYGAVAFGSPLLAGDGLFAKMVYTVPPNVTPTCIRLYSSFFPPGNHLSFVRTDAVGYVPVLKEKCFQVAVRPQTDVPEKDSEKEVDFALKQNYPNPFNARTAIPFAVHCKRSTVNGPVRLTLTIYNILGQKVRTLLDQEKSPGKYQISWDGKDESGKDVASGIYLYRLCAGDLTLIKKMLLLR
jgi:hypothetical protein